MQVLKLDRNCEDAMSELLRVRTHQLTVKFPCRLNMLNNGTFLHSNCIHGLIWSRNNKPVRKSLFFFRRWDFHSNKHKMQYDNMILCSKPAALTAVQRCIRKKGDDSVLCVYDTTIATKMIPPQMWAESLPTQRTILCSESAFFLKIWTYNVQCNLIKIKWSY